MCFCFLCRDFLIVRGIEGVYNFRTRTASIVIQREARSRRAVGAPVALDLHVWLMQFVWVFVDRRISLACIDDPLLTLLQMPLIILQLLVLFFICPSTTRVRAKKTYRRWTRLQYNYSSIAKDIGKEGQWERGGKYRAFKTRSLTLRKRNSI